MEFHQRLKLKGDLDKLYMEMDNAFAGSSIMKCYLLSRSPTGEEVHVGVLDGIDDALALHIQLETIKA